MNRKAKSPRTAAFGGIAGWMIARFRSTQKNAPRLALLERITLGPRQSLALVEAQGRCFLVATSAEGAPAFYALDDSVRARGSRTTRPSSPHPVTSGPARVSW